MDDIPTAPFRVRDAIAAGRSRASIDSRYYEMPFHGVRSARGGDAGVEARCRAYQLRMRGDAAFCGLTAAALWSLPLPIDVDLSRLDVSVPHGMPRPRSRGVRGSERGPTTPTTTLRGLPVLSPAATWVSLAPALGIPDLVAAGDFVIGVMHRDRLASAEDLADAVVPRSPGTARLRAAWRLLRERSLSRPESLLRVLLLAGGVPEPELNHPLAGAGVLIDLAWPEVRFGIEYQGDHHRDPAQFGADIRRQERVHDAGWLLMGVTRYDLFDRPRELLARTRSRLSDRGMRSKRVDPPIWAYPRR